MGSRGLTQRHLEAVAMMAASIEEAGGYVDNVDRAQRDQEYQGVYVKFGVGIPTDVKQVPEEQSRDPLLRDPAVVISDVLRYIWGANPQAPIELEVETLLEVLARTYGRETVEAAVERAHWGTEVPEVDNHE